MAALLLPANDPPPLYWAVTMCAPSVGNVNWHVADPPDTVWLPPEQTMVLAPSLNVTVPAFAVLGVIEAVSVTRLLGVDVNEGLVFEDTVVLVPVALVNVIL